MVGAILGDIIGSPYEFDNIKTKKFPLFNNLSIFTDDTVLTIAVGKALIEWNRNGDIEVFKEKLVEIMHNYGERYPDCGFGGRFEKWVLSKNKKPYYSCGNGSAMRVSAVGWFANSLEEAEKIAKASAEVTHNHPDGIAGACATAAAIYLARNGKTKEQIKSYIEDEYYKIPFTLADIRPTYEFDPTCSGTVPQALEAFFESDSFEDAIRNGVSVGGDSDTLCAITGAVAEAYYGIDDDLKQTGLSFLDNFLLDEYELIINKMRGVKYE